MGDQADSETGDTHFKDLSVEEQQTKRDWLDKESDRIDGRAVAWLENSLRLVLILNAGGVLALLTAAGSLLSKNQDLSPIVSAGTWFLSGLVIAGIGAVFAAWFFNCFANWTHKMYRQTVNNEHTRDEEQKKDAVMDRRHSLSQWFILIVGTVAFIVFVVGVIKSLNAIEVVAKPTTSHSTQQKAVTRLSRRIKPSLQRHLLQR